MTLVAGVDSSTQSCKVVVRDAVTGELIREGRAPHPDSTEVDPEELVGGPAGRASWLPAESTTSLQSRLPPNSTA